MVWLNVFFPKPFSYHFYSLTRRSIMLEKAQFITSPFLDDWEKLRSQDVLATFLVGGQLWEWTYSPGWETNPHMNGLRMLWDLSKKITLPQSSAAQSLYLLQNISPSFVFFFVAALCVQMGSHMADVFPELAQRYPGTTFFATLKYSSQQLNLSPWSSPWSYKWLI